MLETLALAVAVVAALAVRRRWWLTRVRSWSMYPGLRPGDLVVTRAARGRSGLRRGEVVVVDSAELGRRILKRIVGLPGETVEVAPGGVRVGGRRLDEPYPTVSGGRSGTFRVPAGAYLVLGDNRGSSSDSRAWADPYLTADAIAGRVIGRGVAAWLDGSRRGRRQPSSEARGIGVRPATRSRCPDR